MMHKSRSFKFYLGVEVHASADKAFIHFDSSFL